MSELGLKWRKVVSDWQSSGLSQRAFCLQNGYVKSQLSYWHRKFKGESKPPALISTPSRDFVELKSSNKAENYPAEIELEFPSGLLLRVRG